MGNYGQLWRVPLSARRRLRPGLAGILAGVLLSACGSLSLQEERRLGEEEARRLEAEVNLVTRSTVIAYVEELAEQLLTVLPDSDYQYRFRIIDSNAFNAFAVAGGNIYLTRGAILNSRNAAELASILAHEIAHVESGHIRDNYNRFRNSQAVADFTAITLAVATGNPFLAGAGDLAASVGSTVFITSHTRDAERQADALAFRILLDAGFDPRSQLTLLARLQAASLDQQQPMPLMLTHPLPAERVTETRARLAELDDLSGLQINDGGRLEEIQSQLAR